VDATEIVLSVASIWEVGIKHAMGKLPLNAGVPALVDEAARELRARVLPIEMDHVIEAAGLPMHHRDPFDRLLVAQARTEGLTLVTLDEALRPYDVPLLWAAA
jgi:PIN domain nuclease of toxin-antitoxin system